MKNLLQFPPEAPLIGEECGHIPGVDHLINRGKTQENSRKGEDNEEWYLLLRENEKLESRGSGIGFKMYYN